jgi:hypothetical protein
MSNPRDLSGIENSRLSSKHIHNLVIYLKLYNNSPLCIDGKQYSYEATLKLLLEPLSLIRVPY